MNIPEYCYDDFLSGANFAKACDFVFAEVIGIEPEKYIFNQNVNVIKPNDLVFCKLDFVSQFFDSIRRVPTQCKLITGQSADPVNATRYSLKSENVTSWHGTNPAHVADSLYTIPLGLANDFCKVTLKVPDIKQVNSRGDRSELIYINHRIHTNVERRAWIYDHFRDCSWVTIEEPATHGQGKDHFGRQLARHKFVLSPAGTGVECHRTWEALYSGTIPVIEREPVYDAFEGLPILLVDSFKDLTEEFLESKYIEMSSTDWNWDMLTCKWWINNIRDL
jgi:hypothetical protein